LRTQQLFGGIENRPVVAYRASNKDDI
jgi:hypothetical protein